LKICIESGIFEKYGLDVVFRIVPEGTGKLLDLVERKEVDLAIMVTDAFIAGKSNGREVTLLGTYVESPLVWVAATDPANSSINTIQDLTSSTLGRPCRFGISRKGSGSHSMAYYTNMVHKLCEPEHLEFNIANNFPTLREGKCLEVYLY
jgi:sulfonate transport system substrate-binding protein